MKDLTWLKTSYIAHRGLHKKDQSVVENTKTAFEKAVQSNYAIECDLQLLKDDEIVVFHDSNLNRLAHLPKKLSDLTLDEVKAVKLLHTEDRILTLSELLDFVQGRVPLLIEIKPGKNLKNLCARFVQIIESYSGDFAVFSFHPKVVYWFKKNAPEIIRGQIAEAFKDQKMNNIIKYLLKSMFFNRFTKPDFISYGITDLPNHYADRALKKGLTVISYAAQTPEQLEFVKTHYHNVVFEYFLP